MDHKTGPSHYLYAAYVLVLVLGLRKGEVLGLTWDHIHWAGWDKKCAEHCVEFCDHCRDRYDVALRIDKQLQRVRGRLLHRETKTEESDAPLPLPAVCVTALRQRQLRPQVASSITRPSKGVAGGRRDRVTER